MRRDYKRLRLAADRDRHADRGFLRMHQGNEPRRRGAHVVIVIGTGGWPRDAGCILLPRNTDMTQPAEVAHDLVQPRLGVRRLIETGDDGFDKLARQPDDTLIFGLDTWRCLDHQPRNVDSQTERKNECQKYINPST